MSTTTPPCERHDVREINRGFPTNHSSTGNRDFVESMVPSELIPELRWNRSVKNGSPEEKDHQGDDALACCSSDMAESSSTCALFFLTIDPRESQIDLQNAATVPDTLSSPIQSIFSFEHEQSEEKGRSEVIHFSRPPGQALMTVALDHAGPMSQRETLSVMENEDGYNDHCRLALDPIPQPLETADHTDCRSTQEIFVPRHVFPETDMISLADESAVSQPATVQENAVRDHPQDLVYRCVSWDDDEDGFLEGLQVETNLALFDQSLHESLSEDENNPTEINSFDDCLTAWQCEALLADSNDYLPSENNDEEDEDILSVDDSGQNPLTPKVSMPEEWSAIDLETKVTSWIKWSAILPVVTMLILSLLVSYFVHDMIKDTRQNLTMSLQVVDATLTAEYNVASKTRNRYSALVKTNSSISLVPFVNESAATREPEMGDWTELQWYKTLATAREAQKYERNQSLVNVDDLRLDEATIAFVNQMPLFRPVKPWGVHFWSKSTLLQVIQL